MSTASAVQLDDGWNLRHWQVAGVASGRSVCGVLIIHDGLALLVE